MGPRMPIVTLSNKIQIFGDALARCTQTQWESCGSWKRCMRKDSERAMGKRWMPSCLVNTTLYCVCNTHVQFKAQKLKKNFAIDREYGVPMLQGCHLENRESGTAPQMDVISPAAWQTYQLISLCRSIYDQITPRTHYIHVERFAIRCDTIVYCKNIAQFHR